MEAGRRPTRSKVKGGAGHPALCPEKAGSEGISVGQQLQDLGTPSQQPVSLQGGSPQPRWPRLVEAGTGGRRCGWPSAAQPYVMVP